jgi:hypothetical protein
MNSFTSAALTLGGLYMIWTHGTDLRFVVTGAVFVLSGVIAYRDKK